MAGMGMGRCVPGSYQDQDGHDPANAVSRMLAGVRLQRSEHLVRGGQAGLAAEARSQARRASNGLCSAVLAASVSDFYH